MGKQREVGGEEEHILGVAGRPAMGVAHLEQRAGGGAGLLDVCLDDLVDALGDQQAESEEHALQLPAEDEVADEAAETEEDRDQRDPGQEVAQLVALLVSDMGQRHCLERRV